MEITQTGDAVYRACTEKVVVRHPRGRCLRTLSKIVNEYLELTLRNCIELKDFMTLDLVSDLGCGYIQVCSDGSSVNGE